MMLSSTEVIAVRANIKISILLATIALGTMACGTPPEPALTQLMESRRLASELNVQFTKAADASNRAVMADTDESSIAFAHEAERATEAVQKNIDALRPLLAGLGFSNESSVLDQFTKHLGDYRNIDKSVLGLAVQNTNLKAQRLSFGPSNDAVYEFRQALDAVTAANAARDDWHVKALSATAVAAIREVQVLQAPHIAESKDEAMTEMEKHMAASEAEARKSLRQMESLAAPASRAQVTAASTALDRFMALNTQIVSLSRQNTNVRSLALALGQKRTLTASCEDDLRVLQDALASRDFKATR